MTDDTKPNHEAAKRPAIAGEFDADLGASTIIRFLPTEIDPLLIDFFNRERLPVTFIGVKVSMYDGRITIEAHPDIARAFLGERSQVLATPGEGI